MPVANVPKDGVGEVVQTFIDVGYDTVIVRRQQDGNFTIEES